MYLGKEVSDFSPTCHCIRSFFYFVASICFRRLHQCFFTTHRVPYRRGSEETDTSMTSGDYEALLFMLIEQRKCLHQNHYVGFLQEASKSHNYFLGQGKEK
jgi:hypothetical protein